MVFLKRFNFIFVVFIFLISACTPIAKLKIDTIKPVTNPIPYFANNVSFVNLENDINNDLEDDSAIVNIIFNEFLLGVDDIVKKSPRIDSQNVFKANNYISRELFYNDDNNIAWNRIKKLNICKNSDIVFMLDSIYIFMEGNNIEKIFNYDHYEYYKYRKFIVLAYFTTIDIKHKRVIDKYNYNDTLLWENMNVDINTLENDFPDITNSLKISSYWLGYDFASRAFPYWATQERILYVTGNNDFKKAARLFNENKFIEASKIWEKYVKFKDSEIVSRATYNLALASEMNESLDTAIEWLL
ncbi:MAG: DUF6340 family protein, partial [Bacteroidales bacterium]|nr:DUF6340 family protein [Bacteroidales bacterium]